MHNGKDFFLEAKFGHNSSSGLALGPGGMSFIHDHFGPMAPGQLNNFGYGRPVAIHAEDAFGDNHPLPRCGVLLQSIFQGVHVAMSVDNFAGARQPHTVNETGMIQTIGKNNVLFRQDGAKQAGIRGIS